MPLRLLPIIDYDFKPITSCGLVQIGLHHHFIKK